MKDVADILRAAVGDAQLPQLLVDLENSETGRGNTFFREFIRRIRKGAGIAPPVDPAEPKALLDLMEQDGDLFSTDD